MPGKQEAISSVAVPGLVAGMLSALTFREGMVFLLFNFSTITPITSALLGHLQETDPTLGGGMPFTRPALLLAVLGGGACGAVLGLLLERNRVLELLYSFLFGAVLISLAGFLVAAWVQGLWLPASLDHRAWLRAILINGSWGFGTVLLLRMLHLRT